MGQISSHSLRYLEDRDLPQSIRSELILELIQSGRKRQPDQIGATAIDQGGPLAAGNHRPGQGPLQIRQGDQPHCGPAIFDHKAMAMGLDQQGQGLNGR